MLLEEMIIILDQGMLGEKERLGDIMESKEINILLTQVLLK